MLTLDHNGHTITYSENRDVWVASASDMEAKTLSALKTKLNQWDAAKRRVDNVPVVRITDNTYGEDRAGIAVLIDDTDRHKPAVWIYGERSRGGAKGDRRKENFSDLALDTPETREAIDKARQLDLQANELRKQASEMRTAIPRITREDLQGLKPIDETPPPPPAMRVRTRSR